MLPQFQNPQDTFIAGAVRRFQKNVVRGFTSANKWRRQFVAWGHEGWNDTLVDPSSSKSTLSLWVCGSVYALVLIGIIALTMLLLKSLIGKNHGPLVGLLIVLFTILWTLVAGFFTVFLVYPIMIVLGFTGIFVPVILWIPIYALAEAITVVTKLLLCPPFAILVGVMRLLQRWRGIFYTCPSRYCAYRSRSIYVCPRCNTGSLKLWPNLYGLLWHYCESCNKCLPTLDIFGRRKLRRLCGRVGCGMPLDKYTGQVPDRLMALVGGPGSGKTNYLLMAVYALISGEGNGVVQFRGEIDEDTQEEAFWQGWQNLEVGLPVAQTSAVANALLLYTTVGRSRCHLYLYDVPGGALTSISSMAEQRYFPLVEGCILLVDPLSFASVRVCAAGADGKAIPLQDVVASTVAAVSSGRRSGRSGKLPLRVAVVIPKADLACVKDQIGDVRQGPIAGAVCHDAIVRWGGENGENALRALEQRFEAVEYFACSALGRAVEAHNREPFKASGVLEPLAWLLTGHRLE